MADVSGRADQPNFPGRAADDPDTGGRGNARRGEPPIGAGLPVVRCCLSIHRQAAKDGLDQENAIDGDDFLSHDFGRNTRFDGKAVYRGSPGTKLSFGLGASHLERGPYGAVLRPSQTSRLETFRPFVRLDRQFDEDTAGYLQWSGHFENTNDVTGSTYRSARNDLEAQLTFRPSRRHKTTVGGNVRWDQLDDRGFLDQYIVLPDDGSDRRRPKPTRPRAGARWRPVRVALVGPLPQPPRRCRCHGSHGLRSPAPTPTTSPAPA